ncbi:MAG TPA: beta-ketoacyl-[acyl-carrier-protein] synthase family protein, partial [Polyangiaceae bacterium]|nr:beta-ketoacyl-[acyl-carrier-protein] synthase family protein [Polyangiaceae bacterium]
MTPTDERGGRGVTHDDPRIAVSGVGVVSALGGTAETTWQGILAGLRGIGELTLFDAKGYRSTLGAEVTGLRTRPDDSWSRTAEMGLVAAGEAARSADLAGARAAGLRVGLVVGATTGGMFETESLLALLADPKERETTKDDAWRRLLSNPISSTTAWIDREVGPFARTRTLSSACSSGANALAVAADWLLLDLVDVVLAGGADGLCRLTQAGFGALAACDPEPCRPFDARRRGLNLGEGAGFLVLERARTARRRGVQVRCILAGWAIGSEAHHITNPEPTGSTPARLLTESLRRAGLGPASLGYVNAHGTATPLNDAMESAGLVAALGEHLGDVPVSSSKAQLGHTLAAAGAIEAVLTTLVLRDGKLPPTVGLEEIDPACPLRHVLTTEDAEVSVAASSSFGFGGMDSVLVFAAEGRASPPPRPRHEVVVVGAAALTPRGLRVGSATHELLAAPIDGARAVSLDPAWFDAARARRLDRLSRLVTVVAERALAGTPRGAAAHAEHVGLLVGNAWGNLDASAGFMRRVFERGPRLASPAEFPNLVPSSPVGHASVYLGLTGPAFSLCDFAASGEASFLQGFEMVASGEVQTVCVGGVEEASDIVENVLSRVFRDPNERPQRAEGAGACALTTARAAADHGQPVLARVLSAVAFRTGPRAFAATDVEAPTAGSVVLARTEALGASLVAGTPWAACPCVATEGATGAHESAGAITLAAAAGLVASGLTPRVLVVGEAGS